MISLEGGKKTWRSECGGGGREREVANEKSEAVKIRAPHGASAPPKFFELLPRTTRGAVSSPLQDGRPEFTRDRVSFQLCSRTSMLG